MLVRLDSGYVSQSRGGGGGIIMNDDVNDDDDAMMIDDGPTTYCRRSQPTTLTPSAYLASRMGTENIFHIASGSPYVVRLRKNNIACICLFSSCAYVLLSLGRPHATS